MKILKEHISEFLTVFYIDLMVVLQSVSMMGCLMVKYLVSLNELNLVSVMVSCLLIHTVREIVELMEYNLDSLLVQMVV